MKKNLIYLVTVFALLVLFSERSDGKLKSHAPKHKKSKEHGSLGTNHKLRHKKHTNLIDFVYLEDSVAAKLNERSPNLDDGISPRRRENLRRKTLMSKEDRILAQSAEKTLARRRILHDKRHRLQRRKRYQNVYPCAGYYSYNPHNCPQYSCKPCQHPCRSVYGLPATYHGQNVNQYKPYIPYRPSIDYTVTVRPRPECSCNPRGSEIITCDVKTGNCRCKPHYVGRTCDRCEAGYWESSSGCVKCQCDFDGSRSTSCDQNSGRCVCKPGVGGKRCDSCLPGFFAFSSQGCRKCDECGKPGHICDPDTGRCICPPLSHGTSCSICFANCWGYEPNKGCKPCVCSDGSAKPQCDVKTGICTCRVGYAGPKCSRCAHGYYGYPKCRRCNCDISGTDPDRGKCDADNLCQCNNDGSCPCKENVGDSKCNSCKAGTFGLHIENPNGCTPCFCFGRSTVCEDARLTWGQIRTNSTRVLLVSEVPYRKKVIHHDTIADRYGNITASLKEFSEWRAKRLPLYWQLHEIFRGDHILSYGGYVRFQTETFDSNQPPKEHFQLHPLVKLKGNGLELHYQILLPPLTGRHEVRFHESLWRKWPDDRMVTREMLMIVLQNITDIYVKATDSSNFKNITLYEVTVDTAIEVRGNPPPLAMGVELCSCPNEYNSSSCQNPSVGFYRDRTKTPTATITIDTIVGRAEPCRCNGRSNVCDIETGRCLNCTKSTDGFHCEKCAQGYFGNPMQPHGVCKPCPCPSAEQNFAVGCTPDVCICKPGYKGKKCDECATGYFGNPREKWGSCHPCNCNKEGIRSETCSSITGQCHCKPGTTGRQCSQCEKPRHILESYDCRPCDNCTQKLLDHVDQMSNWLYRNASHLQNGTVQPPWEKLDSLAEKYEMLYNRYEKAQDLIDRADLDSYDSRLKSLRQKFDNTRTNLVDVTIDSSGLLENSEEASTEIERLRGRLNQLMATLKDFGKSHINTKDAIEEGTRLLDQIIRQNDKIQAMKNHEIVSQKCKEIKDFVDDINSKTLVGKSNVLKENLNALNARLRDLEHILMDVDDKLFETGTKHLKNKEAIDALRNSIKTMERDAAFVAENIRNNSALINETSRVLNDTEDVLSGLKADEELVQVMKRLQNKETELSDNVKLLETYVKNAKDAAQDLEDRIQGYVSQLHLTDKELDAVNASKAYSNVVNLIDEAEAIAEVAEEKYKLAVDAIAPGGEDSLFINATLAEADSSRLLSRITPLNNKYSEYVDRITNINLKINNITNKLWDNGIINREQTLLIQQLKANATDLKDVKQIMEKAMSHSEKMKGIYRKAMDINITTQYDLAKKFQKYLDLTSHERIRELQKQIKVTKDMLRNFLVTNQTKLDIIKEHNENYKDFYRQNSSIASKLEELKAKIQKSKEIADGIRVSLAGSECTRSYRLNDLEPSLITNLEITFQYNKMDIPSSLFYLAAKDDGHYMNLKTVKGALVFAWKLAGEEKSLEYKNLENELYTVSIERIRNRVKMQINETEYSKEDTDTSVFNVSSVNLLHVGYAPGMTGLPGCVHDIIFNNRKLGFWNFEDSVSPSQCTGCIRKSAPSISNEVRFTGEGYSLLRQKRQERTANPTKILISFWLRTFDENALLFLAPHPNGVYMSLTLKDGHIQFKVHYKNGIEPIVIRTSHKYNDGSKVQIIMGKEYDTRVSSDKASLSVFGEGIDGEKLTEERHVPRGDILKVKKVNYYFGGLPPDFYLDCVGCATNLHTHDSLLGDIYDCSDTSVQLLLYETNEYQQHYGVQLRDGELEFRKAWFEGEGYLELRPLQLQKNFNIAFVLRTSQSNAFIADIGNVIKCTIVDGTVQINFYLKKNITLLSTKPINDDEYHLIEVLGTSKDYVLKIDGKRERSKKHAGGVDLPKANLKFYVGGLPGEIGSRFNGEIGDIIIDDRLIKFNRATIVDFTRGKIGRSMPKKKPVVTDEVVATELRSKGMADSMKDMQNTEGCDQVMNYSLEPNAAKFGDMPGSYVQYYLKESFWKENFVIELEFRTFYKNGMLLFSQGDRGHYNLLEVREGKIQLHVAGKRKKALALSKKVDDGDWHQILIANKAIKRRRKVSLSLDGAREKPKKIPQNKVSGNVFIGDVSKSELPRLSKNMISRLHPFRGCIRELKLNDEPQGFVNQQHIGQCFPNIEKGSYFRGDAYAIYSKFFKVNKPLELNFEFRTTEQNGILMSVSAPQNSPALSIELQNGAVVMSVDMGNGIVSNVTNYLSEYALCNNRWHNVTALLSTELTVNVDGVSRSWVISEGGQMDDIEDPLYIGGLPDSAPGGTLKIRENFKGCIRNIKIGDSYLDWINMEELSNVSLNSCPVA